jgi:4-amino-4-deoxy-L-arabinose transferase-like glycosyltransferase
MRRVGALRKRGTTIPHSGSVGKYEVESFASRTRSVALVAALLAIALRAPLFALPLERDEGEYAYIAWQLGAGETPYLDSFDQKPPGVFLAYRIALAWPGDALVAIRVEGALFAAAGALALFGLARALLGPVAGAVAALLLAFLSADPMLQGPIANTEIFMVPWIVAAALLTVRSLGDARPPLVAAVAVGLLLGVATAFKQVAVVNAPFFLAVCAWRAPRGARVRATARFAAAIAAGALLVWGIFLLWFWRRGALAPALDAIVLHNLEYASDLTRAERWGALQYFLPQLLPSQGAAWLLAGLGLVALARRAHRFPALFLAGFAAVNALGVSASGFYFPHYFQQLLPAVAALAAAAIAGVPGVAPPRWRLAAGSALAIAPLAAAAIEFGRISPAEASQWIYPNDHFDAMPAVAAEVASQTLPEDRVFLFASEPEVLFYARRVSASRYIFLFPVFGRFSDAEARQAEVIAEVEAARPAVIVWMPMESFFGRGRPQRLTEWTSSYIDAHYRLRAYAVALADGRSQIVRAAPGGVSRAELAARQPWATIFVRAQ